MPGLIPLGPMRFEPRRLSTVLRKWPRVLAVAAFLPLLVGAWAAADDRKMMYPYAAAVFFLCCVLCVRRGAKKRLADRRAWFSLGLSFLVGGLAYCWPLLAIWGMLPVRQGSWLESACTTVSLAFSLYAIAGMKPGRDGWVRALDGTLVSLVGALVIVASSSGGPTGVSAGYLYIGFAAQVFVAAAAWASYLTATTPSSMTLSAIVALYFGLRVLVAFLINIVDYSWLPVPRTLPADILYALPELAFCLLVTRRPRIARKRSREVPDQFLQNLLPSLLALAGVVLTQSELAGRGALAGAVVIAVMLAYMLRTHLSYQQMLREQMSLRSRASYMEELATIDALTGIGNRRWFDGAASALLGARGDRCITLLLVDVDRFKEINDTFGHLFGDEVLRHIGEILGTECRRVGGDCCARMGGDEFAALVPAPDVESAVALGERIRLSVEARKWEEPFRATVTVGMAAAFGHTSVAELMELADSALYRAKERGRNMVEMSGYGCGDELESTPEVLEQPSTV